LKKHSSLPDFLDDAQCEQARLILVESDIFDSPFRAMERGDNWRRLVHRNETSHTAISSFAHASNCPPL
jgi:hypothetical protein